MKNLIIIPAYNESKRLEIDKFSSFLGENSNNIHLLFVDDGSSDKTANIIEERLAIEENCSLLKLNKNKGKAEAIRAAIHSQELSNYNFLGYFDADLATPLSEIPRLIAILEKNKEAQLLMGSRIQILGMTQIKRRMSRHYFGRVFATIVSSMLGIPIYDTQCGAKFFKAEIAKELFREKFISKWLFDVEIIFRLKKLTTEVEGKIIEVPLKEWTDKAGSKIRWSYLLQLPIDLARIYFRYR